MSAGEKVIFIQIYGFVAAIYLNTDRFDFNSVVSDTLIGKKNWLKNWNKKTIRKF